MRDHQSRDGDGQGAEIVATFGDAEIVKHRDGRLEIHGGSEHEKSQAHDWMEKFLAVTPLTLQRIG